jgi:hypothetical protein
MNEVELLFHNIRLGESAKSELERRAEEVSNECARMA